MKITFVILGLVLSSTVAFAAQYEAFDLVQNGNQVCKSGKKVSSQQCLSNIRGIAPLQIELIDALKSDAKPSAELTDKESEFAVAVGHIHQADKEFLLKNYKRISIRNFVLDQNQKMKTAEGILIPFYVSVYWVGKYITQGTIHITGQYFLSNNDVQGSGDFVNGFSDSSTEMNWESLRWLERTARYVNIKSVYGYKTNVNEQTIKMIEQYFLNAISSVYVSELLKTMNSSKPAPLP